MIVPSVFSPALCGHLLQCHQEHMPKVSGKRHNIAVFPTPELSQAIDTRAASYLYPEIERRTGFEVGSAEPWRIVCYFTGASFPPHTDVGYLPEMEGTRRYAASILLSPAEAGGELVVADVVQHLDVGDAAVWAVETVHEVKPILAGARYVLLTFLHPPPRANFHSTHSS